MRNLISILCLIKVFLIFPGNLKGQTKVPYPNDTKLSEIIGVVHSNGKYRFTTDNFLKEGLDEIENMGSKVVKLFFGNQAKNVYPSFWGCDWDSYPFANLTELAQTPYFIDAFGRPGIKTYILNAHEVSNGGNVTNFKTGITISKRNNLYNELYNLTTYLYNTYAGTGKTFVLSNWEGDGMLGFVDRPNNLPPPDTTRMWLQGFTDWLNIRQEAITDARNAAIQAGKTDVLVVGAAECNHVSIQKEYDWPTMVDSVIPYTRMDLYAFSNWKTNKLSTVDDFNATLNYIKEKAPDSEMFGEDNLFLGEIGTFELVNLVGNIPAHTTESDRVAREVMQRNIELALKFGIRYIAHWQIFCNGLRSGVTLPPGQNAVESQLTGTGIRRANGSYSGTYNYYKSIMQKSIGEYLNVYEAEAQVTNSSAGTSHEDIRFNSASGEYFSKLNATNAGDWINYALRVSQTDSCNIKVKVRKGTSYGKFKLTVGSFEIDTVMDSYNNGNIFDELDMGTVKFDSAGVYNFKFEVVGKTGSRYDLGIDAIEITPINKMSQTITFNPLSSKSVNEEPFKLEGYSSSGLSLQYESSNPDVAKITSAGAVHTVTLLKAGTTSITASQGGSNSFHAAVPVQHTLLVTEDSGLIPTEIIVDNVDAEFTRGGTWSVSGSSADRYGINYAHDGTAGSDVGKWAKWTPNILGTGKFNVYMIWNGGTSRPKDAPIEIAGDNVTDSITVNQHINSGLWNFLGRYNLKSGLSNYVKIDATSSGYTVADAVKFVLKELKVPTGLNVTSSSPNSVDILWNSIYGATGYNIYSSSSEAGPFTKVNSSLVTDTTLFINPISPGLYYRVTAVSAYGESNFSEFSSAFPKNSQSISFGSLTPVDEDEPPFQLTAIATSGLPVTYTSSDTTVAAISGDTLIVKMPGFTTIRASQSGNENYLVAADVSQTLVVNPVNTVLNLEKSKIYSFKGNTGFGNSVALNWTVRDDEDSIAYFDVEKLKRETLFVSIGQIPFKKGTNTYNFIDNNNLEEYNYYRLKIVSKQGTVDYSPTLVWKTQQKIDIFPNPAKDILNINGVKLTDRITVINSIGKKVDVFLTDRNDEKVRLDIKGLSTGIYIVIIKDMNGKSRKAFRFIKN